MKIFFSRQNFCCRSSVARCRRRCFVVPLSLSLSLSLFCDYASIHVVVLWVSLLPSLRCITTCFFVLAGFVLSRRLVPSLMVFLVCCVVFVFGFPGVCRLCRLAAPCCVCCSLLSLLPCCFAFVTPLLCFPCLWACDSCLSPTPAGLQPRQRLGVPSPETARA